MRIENFLCWVCEKPKHYTVMAWHEVKPGQKELICDEDWRVLRNSEEKVAA